MITHVIPYAGTVLEPSRHGPACAGADICAAPAEAKPEQPAGLMGRHGPVCVALHAAARREGAGVDPGAIPRGADARRLRGPLLLPDAGPAGARCRRQCAAGGNRSADCALRALFGAARAICGGALRDERSFEDGWRGEGDAHRAAEVAAWLPGSGGGSARSTGMMAGSGSGSAVAGGLARHIPVLVRRVVEFLAVRDGGVYVDATFGAGGYTRAMLAGANCNVIGIDRDQSAVARGAGLVETSGGRLTLVE